MNDKTCVQGDYESILVQCACSIFVYPDTGSLVPQKFCKPLHLTPKEFHLLMGWTMDIPVYQT